MASTTASKYPRKVHSCVGCRAKKISCDKRVPSCKACLRKGDECVYPDSDARYQVTRRRSCVHCQRRRMRCDRSRPCASCVRASLRCTYDAGVRDSLDGIIIGSFPDGEVEHESRSPSGAPNVNTTNGEQQDSFPTILLGSHVMSSETSSLHPSVAQVWAIFNIFLENVDPLLKLLHAPSFQKQLLGAVQHMDAIDNDLETLLFSIYFAAIASCKEEGCQSLLNTSKVALLKRYRFGLEQCLLRANCLMSPSLAMVQALVLYLATVGHTPLDAPMESLLALVIQLARKLDLHDEPVETTSQHHVYKTLAQRTKTELRRRAWWHIVALDVQLAEDTGRDPILWEGMWSTVLPRPFDDIELDLFSDLPLPPRAGETFDENTYMIQQPEWAANDNMADDRRTDLSFVLIRFIISYAVRRFVFSDQFCIANKYDCLHTATERIAVIEKVVKDLDQRFLQFCNRNDMFSFFERNAAKLILSRHLMMVKKDEQPFEVLRNAILVLEAAAGMRRTHSKWAWLLRSHVELHALQLLWKCLGILIGETAINQVIYPTAADDGERIRHGWDLAETAFQRGKEDSLDDCYGDKWARIVEARDIAIARREFSGGISNATQG